MISQSPILPRGVIGLPCKAYRYGARAEYAEITSVAQARELAGAVLRLEQSELDAWNTPYCDFVHVGCPACTNASQYLTTDFDWTPRQPERISCRHCGYEFPGSRFPLNHETIVRTPAGSDRRYPYHLGADGRRYYMESAVLHLRRRWLREQALLLACLFTESGDPQAALRAAAILRRFAEIHDEVPVHGPEGGSLYNPRIYEFDGTYFPRETVQPVPEEFGEAAIRVRDKGRFPYLTSRAGMDFGYIWDEIPLDLLTAYDQIRHTLDIGMVAQIDGYFRAAANYVRSFPRFLYNAEARLAFTEVYCGRVIGEPEIVRGGVERANLILHHRFYADGSWYEGAPGYAAYVIENLEKAFACAGEEFLTGEHTDRFADLRAAFAAMITPGGGIASVYDTFSPSVLTRYMDTDYRGFGCQAPARSRLLWAGGHAVLVAGTGNNQVQARLQFMGQSSHFHYDRLGLSLHAHGCDISSDIGYSHTALRQFTTSMVSHNLVMVDERSQVRRSMPFGGKVLRYSERHPQVRVVSVDAPDACMSTNVYRRTLAIVQVSGGHCYVVDVFEVSGGQQHDWLLHGCADRKERIITAGNAVATEAPLFASAAPLTWTSERGTPGTGENGETLNHLQSLGLIRDVMQIEHPEECGIRQFDFRPVSDGGPFLRSHLACDPGLRLFRGLMPSVRGAQEVNGEVLDHWMPLLVARRTGPGLRSRFVAIHEPCRPAACIEDVKLSGDAIIIRTASSIDVHFPGKPGSVTIDEQLVRLAVAEGEAPYAFVRLRDGRAASAMLAGTGQLETGTMRMGAGPEPHGDVAAIEGAKVILDGTVDAAPGTTMILSGQDGTCFALPVGHCEKAGNRSCVMLAGDPGIVRDAATGAWRHAGYPGTSFEGALRYRILAENVFSAN